MARTTSCLQVQRSPVFAVNDDGRYRDDWMVSRSGVGDQPKFNAPDGPICADLRTTGRCSPPQTSRKASPQRRSKARSSFAARRKVCHDSRLGTRQYEDAQHAIDAINSTRGSGRAKNRISRWGRTDGVIARSAWGRPIPSCNRRNRPVPERSSGNSDHRGFRAGGADAGHADHQALLGNEHSLAD